MTRDATSSIVLLTRLARLIYRRSTQDLLGIQLKELAVLAFLRERSDAGSPPSQQAVMEALCVDANTCVLVLNQLESAGFAERHRDPSDRRRHVVRLTDAGRDAIRSAEEAMATIEHDVLHGLTDNERATLAALLGKALDAHTS